MAPWSGRIFGVGRGWALCVAAAAILGAVPSLAADVAPPASGTPVEARAPSEDKSRDWFTDLPLVTHQGETVRFYSDILAGKVVLLSGFYVNCETVSPRQNTYLSQLQAMLGDQLGRDVFLVSITVDPRRDTPEKVAEYAKVWRPKPGWTFLSGKVENVDWVNYRLGQYTDDPETHEGIYLLGNLRTGLWMKIPPQASPDVLRARITQALLDAGTGVPR